MQIDSKHYQVIFDPVSKGAVIVRKDKTVYLDGPFSTFAEAETASFAYLEENEGIPNDTDQSKQKSRPKDRD